MVGQGLGHEDVTALMPVAPTSVRAILRHSTEMEGAVPGVKHLLLT
jgi:hypothetical protein